jgi:hypothetical protein
MKKIRLRVKAAQFFTADGVLIDFGDDYNELDEIAVGATGKVDGKPCQGEYLMPDGRKFIFEEGTLIEIKEPTMQNLKAENLKLKQQLSDTINFIQSVEKDLVVFKKNMKSCLMPRKPFNKAHRTPSGLKQPFIKQ